MKASIIGNVDECGDATTRDAAGAISPTAPVVVRGWACSSSGDCVDRVIVQAGDNTTIEAWYGYARPDVTAAVGERAHSSGFLAVVPAACHNGRSCRITVTAFAGIEKLVLSEKWLVPKTPLEVQSMFIDEVTLLDGSIPPVSGTTISGRAGQGLRVRGWALDSANRVLSVLDAVVAEQRYPATIGYPRDDVAEVFGTTAARFSGFIVVLPALDAGLSTLHFEGRAADGSAFRFTNPYQIITA